MLVGVSKAVEDVVLKLIFEGGVVFELSVLRVDVDNVLEVELVEVLNDR